LQPAASTSRNAKPKKYFNDFIFVVLNN